MVRISDILKRVEERRAKEQAKGMPAQPQGDPSTGPVQENQAAEQPERVLRISPTVMDKAKLFNEKEALELYQFTIGLVKAVYEKARLDKDITLDEQKDIVISVEKFVNQQSLDNEKILSLISLNPEGDFIYYNAVNVCIIAIDIGIGLGYEKLDLIELGTIAILHDVGMSKYQDLYNQPRELSDAEYQEIKNHPQAGSKIIEKLGEMYKRAVSVIMQEHELVDGSGYPNGLNGDSIDEYAKIIGVADVY